MALAEWLYVIGAILALIVVVLIFILLSTLHRDTDKERKRAKKCGDASSELIAIQEAGMAAKRERSREKCEKVSQDIEAWNAKYAGDCAGGKEVPRLNCDD